MAAILGDIAKKIFPDPLFVDDREALTTFKVAGFDGTFTVYPPKAEFWINTTKGVLLQIIATSIYAVLIYKFIIPNRNKVSAKLLGFGVLMPSALLLPYLILDFFGIANKTIRVGFMVLPFNVFFRTIEAMYDTSPPTIEDSLTNYLIYLSSCVDFKWTSKGRIKATIREAAGTMIKFVITFIIASISISLLRHFDYQPYLSNTVIDGYTLPDLGQLANNYLYAMMTCFTLSVCMQLAIVMNNLQGFSSESPFQNPLFESKSISDFWGHRWNLIVQRGLKRGAFKPVLKEGGPMWAAQLAAFLASGLLHEYLWSLIFCVTQADLDPATGECLEGRCYYPKHGKQMLFFGYCGICMLLEKPIGKLAPVRWMVKNVPLMFRSTLIVLTALPLAHWFTGDWIVGGYFEDHLIGLFKITYTAAA